MMTIDGSNIGSGSSSSSSTINNGRGGTDSLLDNPNFQPFALRREACDALVWVVGQDQGLKRAQDFVANMVKQKVVVFDGGGGGGGGGGILKSSIDPSTPSLSYYSPSYNTYIILLKIAFLKKDWRQCFILLDTHITPLFLKQNQQQMQSATTKTPPSSPSLLPHTAWNIILQVHFSMKNYQPALAHYDQLQRMLLSASSPSTAQQYMDTFTIIVNGLLQAIQEKAVSVDTTLLDLDMYNQRIVGAFDDFVRGFDENNGDRDDGIKGKMMMSDLDKSIVTEIVYRLIQSSIITPSSSSSASSNPNHHQRNSHHQNHKSRQHHYHHQQLDFKTIENILKISHTHHLLYTHDSSILHRLFAPLFTYLFKARKASTAITLYALFRDALISTPSSASTGDKLEYGVFVAMIRGLSSLGGGSTSGNGELVRALQIEQDMRDMMISYQRMKQKHQHHQDGEKKSNKGVAQVDSCLPIEVVDCLVALHSMNGVKKLNVVLCRIRIRIRMIRVVGCVRF